MPARSFAHGVHAFSPSKLARSLCSKAMSRALPIVEFATLELSAFSSKLTREDVVTIFKGYAIADFHLANPTNFSYPFRLLLQIVSHEAKAAVEELDGRLVHGKKISLKLVDLEGLRRWESEVNGMAAELKNNVINIARVYHRQHSAKILEVRELVTATHYYAFLQAREPMTVFPSPEKPLLTALKKVKWEFIAGEFIAVKDPNERHSKSQRLYNGRLEALRNLATYLEALGTKRSRAHHSNKQVALEDTWKEWEGSWLADY